MPVQVYNKMKYPFEFKIIIKKKYKKQHLVKYCVINFKGKYNFYSLFRHLPVRVKTNRFQKLFKKLKQEVRFYFGYKNRL